MYQRSTPFLPVGCGLPDFDIGLNKSRYQASHGYRLGYICNGRAPVLVQMFDGNRALDVTTPRPSRPRMVEDLRRTIRRNDSY